MRQGTVAMSQGQLGRALERFDRIVDLAPEFAEGWNKRATVLYLMGDYQASVLDIQRTLELEPRHFGALSGLGLIYDAIEEPAAALRSFEAALEIHPHLVGTLQRIEELRRQLSGRRT
jgi:tetratricopeptide (TPR) repeat protein